LAFSLRPGLTAQGGDLQCCQLSGGAACGFLGAVNSGDSGSITTVSAGSPHAAIDQIALMLP
jgi:hypothetical protein